MPKNLTTLVLKDEAGGEAPEPSGDAVETLHGGDTPGEAELVLPAHDDENAPEEQRRKP